MYFSYFDFKYENYNYILCMVIHLDCLNEKLIEINYMIKSFKINKYFSHETDRFL